MTLHYDVTLGRREFFRIFPVDFLGHISARDTHEGRKAELMPPRYRAKISEADLIFHQ